MPLKTDDRPASGTELQSLMLAEVTSRREVSKQTRDNQSSGPAQGPLGSLDSECLLQPAPGRRTGSWFVPRALFSAFNGVLLTAFCRPTDLIPIWFIHCFQSFLAGCFWGWGTLIALLLCPNKGTLPDFSRPWQFCFVSSNGPGYKAQLCSCPTLWP